MSGAERHLLTLLPRLASDGVIVRALVATSGEGESFVAKLRDLRLEVTSKRAGPDLNPHLYKSIHEEIQLFRPDLVHTHLIHADVHGIPAATRAGVPAISSLHSTHGFYYRTPYRWLSRRAVRTIAISEHVARLARRHGLNSPDSIQVVPYGIDVSDRSPSDPVDQGFRERLGLKEGDVAFGVASRLIPGKGHSTVIDAFNRLVSSNRGAVLLIAGHGPLRSELQRQAESAQTDRTRFLGFVEDMESFMHACDVLIFPTLPVLGEGFGLAALEAMAAGRPVIATSVGPLPEIVEHERTGLLVRPGDVEVLEAAMARFSTRPEEGREMGLRGRQRAEECFSAGLMAKRVLGVYEAGI